MPSNNPSQEQTEQEWELDEATWVLREKKVKVVNKLELMRKIQNASSKEAAEIIESYKQQNFEPKRITVKRAVCVGYEDPRYPTKPGQLIAEAKAALEKGYNFRLFLDVKDEAALATWTVEYQELMKLLDAKDFSAHSSIVRLEEYEKEVEWQLAKAAFEKFLKPVPDGGKESDENNKPQNSALRKVQKNFKKFLKDLVEAEQERLASKYQLSAEEVEKHLVQGMITILSWCKQRSPGSEYADRYSNIHTCTHGEWINDYIEKFVGAAGYEQSSLVHLVPKYKRMTRSFAQQSVVAVEPHVLEWLAEIFTRSCETARDLTIAYKTQKMASNVLVQPVPENFARNSALLFSRSPSPGTPAIAAVAPRLVEFGNNKL